VINSLLHKTIAIPWLEYEDFSEGWSVRGEPPEERVRRTVSATEGWNQLLGEVYLRLGVSGQRAAASSALKLCFDVASLC